MHCWTIIAAGGKGLRIALPGSTRPKQFLAFMGRPLFWHAALSFTRTARMRGLVFVFPEPFLEEAQTLLSPLMAAEAPGLPWQCVAGGESRRESVGRGLAALPAACDTVLVHDAARPFVNACLVNTVLDALEGGASAVIPGIPVTDTVKRVDETGRVLETPARDRLRAVQTPQGFCLTRLQAAHAEAATRGLDATDDAMLLEMLGETVLVVPGQESNRKITTPEDLNLLREREKATRPRPDFIPRTGFGYDVHRYNGPRPLVLGGIPIPTEITVQAHSDGDTLLHALTDALLGCLGQGDIGGIFPDTDPTLEGISSGIMLAEVMQRVERAGLILCHADLTIVAQTPKIAPHREAIRRNIAALLGLPPEQVNLKATTEERLGFTGEKLGIKAYAVVSALAAVSRETGGEEGR